jgi:hypothetical protein
VTASASSRGYNPCPTAVLRTIATLAAASIHHGTLLDNCAGDGAAASFLAKAWNLDAYLVEVDASRAASCRTRGTAAVLHGSARYVEMKPAPSVWYFNPPFDPAESSGSLERRLFEASARYAVGLGVLGVLVLPHRSLVATDLGLSVLARFENVAARRFPEPWFEHFGQVVVFGYGKPEPSLVSDADVLAAFATCAPLRRREFQYHIHELADPVTLFRLADRTSPKLTDLRLYARSAT